MTILEQIEKGILVSPISKKRLNICENGQWLTTRDQSEKYFILNNEVPVFLENPLWAEEYVKSSQKMVKEYSPDYHFQAVSGWQKTKNKLLRIRKTERYTIAENNFFDCLKKDAICLSIGGGPSRPNDKLTNLNIGPFPNVDIVADAHHLPYADESVDAIYCIAVLEHLSEPVTAIREMFRVLKKGGKILVDTPFLQGYHGYPHHYQNFTLTGQKHIFEANNFVIIDSGVSVGPTYTMSGLSLLFVRSYMPTFISWPLCKMMNLAWSIVLLFDKCVASQEDAHILASGTFIVAEKRNLGFLSLGKCAKPQSQAETKLNDLAR